MNSMTPLRVSREGIALEGARGCAGNGCAGAKSRRNAVRDAMQVEGTVVRVQARPLLAAVQHAGALSVSNTVCDRINGTFAADKAARRGEWGNAEYRLPGGRVGENMPPILTSPVGRKGTLAAAATVRPLTMASAHNPFSFIVSWFRLVKIAGIGPLGDPLAHRP